MRTDDLIVSLAAGVAPVRVIAPLGWRCARWAGAAIASSAIAVWLIGPRADVVAALARAGWVTELSLLVVACGLAGAAAQVSGVPGAAGGRGWRAAAIVAFGAWIGWVLVRLVEGAVPLTALASEPAHVACAARIAAVALGPGAMAWWQLRRAAALQPGWSAALAGAAAFGAGAVAAQVMCPLDEATHVLTWHVAPVVVLTTAAGVLAARRR